MSAYRPGMPPAQAAALQFITDRLRDIPMFERLTPDQLARVASIVQVMRYEPGAIIFQQGTPAQGLIVYAQGTGVLTRINAQGYEERVSIVEPGVYLGESALAFEETHTVTLRAMQPSTILLLAQRDLTALLIHAPEIRTNLRIPLAPGTASAALYGSGSRGTGQRLFTGQRSDETVLEIHRRHPWAFLRGLWLPFLLTAGALAGIVVLGGQSPVWIALFGLFGLIIPGLIVVYLYLEWRNDFLIITDQRVIRIWRHLLRFENQINEIPLERILEVSVEIPPADPMAQIFNYGTITLRTAGEANHISLSIMPNPKAIQQRVFAQRDRFQEVNERNRRQAIQQNIEQALGLRPAQTATAVDNGNAAIVQIDTVGLPFLRTRFLNDEGDVIYRRHVTVWLEHTILPLLLLASSLMLPFLAGLLQLPVGVMLGAAGLAGIIGLIWLYLADWDWRNDMMILGRDRITLVHRRPMFLQNEEQIVRLAQVDNVMSEVTGPLNTLLNRGTIRISLLGSNEAKIFDKVYDPASIQAELSHRQTQYKAREQQAETRDQQQQMAEYIAVYHQTMMAAQQGGLNGQPAQPTAQPQATPAPHFQPTQPVQPVQPTRSAPPAQPAVAPAAYAPEPTSPRPRFEPPAGPPVTNAPSARPHLPQRDQPFNTQPHLPPIAPATPPDLPEAGPRPGAPPPPPDLPELPPLSESIRPPKIPRRRADDLPT